MNEEVRRREYGKDRSERMVIRLTESEKTILEKQAEEAGLSLAEYVRSKFKFGFVHIKETTGRVVGPSKRK